MNRSRLPLLGIAAGALLVVGSLLALGGLAGTPAGGAGGGMAAPAAHPSVPSVTPTVTLTGTMWEWVRTETNDGTVVTATDPTRYTVEFLDGGQMAIRADCNRGSATYVTNGPELLITPGAFTGRPSISMRPATGGPKPAIALNIVVLPQPLGPSRQPMSPSPRLRLKYQHTGPWPGY